MKFTHKAKAFLTILSIMLTMTSSALLVMNKQNPIIIGRPVKGITNMNLNFRFNFASESSSLNYGEYFGITFPTELGDALALDALNSANKQPNYVCTLSDGVFSYKMTAVYSLEKNSAFCRLDETTTGKVPLDKNLSYALLLRVSTIMSERYYDNVVLFTSTSNDVNRRIIDIAPQAGNLAVYDNPELESSTKLISITASTFTRSGTTSTEIYYNSEFDWEVSLKANSFISTEDCIIMVSYPTIIYTPPTSIETKAVDPSNPLKVALLTKAAGLSSYPIVEDGTSSFVVDGINENLVRDREFKLKFKSGKSLNSSQRSNNYFYIRVLYKNTRSVISMDYVSLENTSIPLTLTVKHPEGWDVYRGGAFPILFTISSPTELPAETLIRITNIQTIIPSSTASQNSLTFIPSTCDFSEIANVDHSFGVRPKCYPVYNLRSNCNNNGCTSPAGFFVILKQKILANTEYKITIWIMFDVCGKFAINASTLLNLFHSGAEVFTKPTFNIQAYTSINPKSTNESRFNTDKASKSQVHIAANSNPVVFEGVCWNNLQFSFDSVVGQDWTTTVTNAIDYTSTINSIIHYKEIFDWVSFNPNSDNSSSLTAGFLKDPTNTRLTTVAPNSNFLYSNSANTLAGSYFAIATSLFVKTGSKLLEVFPIPFHKIGTAISDPKGRWNWQFPKDWFVGGKSYKSTDPTACYASWHFSTYNTAFNTKTSFSGNDLLTTLTTDAIDYASITAKKNYFGSKIKSPISGLSTSTIDVSRSLLPPQVAVAGTSPILRLVFFSYYDGVNDQRWAVTSTSISTLTVRDYLQVAFFSNCVKWRDTLPAIKSLYTAIDIHIKWDYQANANSQTYTISNTRFIKLFPETGVFNDFTKNPKGTNENPFISHTTITFTNTIPQLCIIEVNSSILTHSDFKCSSKTLVMWIFFGTLLDDDYDNIGNTYPAAPLNSSVKVYGLQSSQSMTYLNPLITTSSNSSYTPLLLQIKNNNSSRSMSSSIETLMWQASSSYLYFFSSVLYFTNVEDKLTDLTNEKPLFIPYYCPNFVQNITGSFTSEDYVRRSFPFPLYMAAWMTITNYNTISSLDTWITYKDNSKDATVITPQYIKVMGNKWDGINLDFVKKNTSAVFVNVKSYFSNFNFITSNNELRLQIFNGTYKLANANDIYCTGHALLLDSSIELEDTVTFNAGYTGAMGVYKSTNLFYFFGKAFSQAIFYGLGAATNFPLETNMKKQLVGESVRSAVYFTGVKRPDLTIFVSYGKYSSKDKIVYYCASAKSTANEMMITYGSSFTFVLDMFTNNLSSTVDNKAYDNDDFYQGDTAVMNFKFDLTLPSTMPDWASEYRFTSAQFKANSQCGIVANDKIVFALPCTYDAVNNYISCPISIGGTSFTFCCYNITHAATISITKLQAIGTFENVNVLNDSPNTIIVDNTSHTIVTPSLTRTVGAATIKGVTYSQVEQLNGIGKITLEIELPRQILPDMEIAIVGDLSELVFVDETPRCFVTTIDNSRDSENYAIFEKCSTANLATSGNSSNEAIKIMTKKNIYKCNKIYGYTFYVTIWPVKVVNLENKSLKITVKNTSTAGDLANNNTPFTLTTDELPTLNQTYPVIEDLPTLCNFDILHTIPNDPNILKISIDFTENDSLVDRIMNEVSILLPQKYFANSIDGLICNLESMEEVPCTIDEGILNIQVKINNGVKKDIYVSLVPGNVDFTTIVLSCTVNEKTDSTRVNLITGSGTTTTSNFSQITYKGVLNFRNIPNEDKLTNNSPRAFSTHKFRVSLDNIQAVTDVNFNSMSEPTLFIFFPNEYKLVDLGFDISVKEVRLVAGIIVETILTIQTTSILRKFIKLSFSKNMNYYTFTDDSFWEITINNINNPATNEKYISTGAFKFIIFDVTDGVLFKTYNNLNNYYSDLLPIRINSYIQWNRGNEFYESEKVGWNTYQVSNPNDINRLIIERGTYVQVNIELKFGTLPASPGTLILDHPHIKIKESFLHFT